VTAISVLIVDDHPVVRDGLRGMLAGQPDLVVAGEACDGVEAVEQAILLEPSVVLMDLRMPGGDGVEAIRQIHDRSPESRVLVLTTFDTDADILRAIDGGAVGYLLKDTPREELHRAIRMAARGEPALAPTVAARLLGRARTPFPEALSAREIEVLELIARGLTNREVARRLYLSEATVKTHALHIFAKLGVDDRTAAVTVAIERGIIRLNS
jgi:DNA-binding NarL/FixJ family response regulator